MSTLSTPNKKKFKDVPKKTGNPILDLWFESQYELENGQVPSLVKDNEVELKNVGRTRAPTTWETLQNTIDQKTSLQKETDTMTADYTDDEDDEDDIEYYKFPLLKYDNNTKPLSPNEIKQTNRGEAIRRKWFKAQAQLAEGVNPSILKKYGNGYRIEDLRKFNKDYQHRSKGSEQYLEITTQLTHPRKSIAADVDVSENEDDEENDEPVSDIEI
ncbi:hypothetical protein RFI_06064 [Reticulomyxa filosa]|uniref:Uncharacterized protein n=1 Tax=Reticulomyxa filosa TaxID=46433 RepID=X6NXM0_RETFI|nr:hypothetical protein RFI_06064 [Reticulomyxa filosa]|eukprot:ETO31055.1 hypothetical protein RFI_06064 [Reticulomyxa filosa]